MTGSCWWLKPTIRSSIRRRLRSISAASVRTRSRWWKDEVRTPVWADVDWGLLSAADHLCGALGGPAERMFERAAQSSHRSLAGHEAAGKIQAADRDRQIDFQ